MRRAPADHLTPRQHQRHQEERLPAQAGQREQHHGDRSVATALPQHEPRRHQADTEGLGPDRHQRRDGGWNDQDGQRENGGPATVGEQRPACAGGETAPRQGQRGQRRRHALAVAERERPGQVGGQRPLGAAVILRRSLLVYGAGGIIAPFAGIKLIDLVLAGLRIV